MTKPSSPAPVIVSAVLLAVVAGGAWWWRLTVARPQRAAVPGDPWEHVKTQYPLPPEPGSLVKVAPETLEAIVRANPFSPQRRFVPPPPAESAGGAGPAGTQPPPAPTFVYKGRIALGNRTRAIVEDLTTKKTHFLEVGQVVAGFKVLDIAEHQVVLSALHTHQEVVVSLATSDSQ